MVTRIASITKKQNILVVGHVTEGTREAIFLVIIIGSWEGIDVGNEVFVCNRVGRHHGT